MTFHVFSPQQAASRQCNIHKASQHAMIFKRSGLKSDWLVDILPAESPSFPKIFFLYPTTRLFFFFFMPEAFPTHPPKNVFTGFLYKINSLCFLDYAVLDLCSTFACQQTSIIDIFRWA